MDTDKFVSGIFSNKKNIIIAASVIVLIIVIVVAAVLLTKGSSDTGSGTTSSAQTSVNGGTSGQKNDAKTVIDAIKDEGQEVVVEEYPKRIVNVLIDKEDERLEVREEPNTGVLNGIELSVSYTSETRAAKLEGFFAEIKKIIKACDSSITDERADAIVIRFKQSIPEGDTSTSCTETEGAYSFAVSYFPDKAYFVVS